MAFYFCLDFSFFCRKREAKPPVEHECAFRHFTGGTWQFFSSKCLLFHNKIFEPNSEIRMKSGIFYQTRKNMVFFKKNILYFCKKIMVSNILNFSGYLFKSHPFKGARSSSMFRFPQLHHTTLKPRCQEEGDSQKGTARKASSGVRIGRFQGSISSDGRNPKQAPGMYKTLLLMEEILHHLIGSSSHYLQGFIHLRWCRISSINRMTTGISTTSSCRAGFCFMNSTLRI